MRIFSTSMAASRRRSVSSYSLFSSGCKKLKRSSMAQSCVTVIARSFVFVSTRHSAFSAICMKLFLHLGAYLPSM